MERASATAAYEHELEAIPNSVASVRFFGVSPPRAFAIDWWETTAWIIPERAKPSTSGQRISHSMLQAIKRAWPILVTSSIYVPFSSQNPASFLSSSTLTHWIGVKRRQKMVNKES